MLKQAYKLTKELRSKSIQPWFTSVIYILRLLGFVCRNRGGNQLISLVKGRLTEARKREENSGWKV